MVTLTALQPGQSAVITNLHFDEALTARLAALGFRIGKQVAMIRRARFAGPLHVRIGSTDIMLRGKEANQIDVTLA